MTAQRKLLRYFNSFSMDFSVSNCVNLHAEYVQETRGSEKNERYRYQIVSNFLKKSNAERYQHTETHSCKKKGKRTQTLNKGLVVILCLCCNK